MTSACQWCMAGRCFIRYIKVTDLGHEWPKGKKTPLLLGLGLQATPPRPEHRYMSVCCWGDEVLMLGLGVYIWWCVLLTTPPSPGPGSLSWCCFQTRQWCFLSGHCLWWRYTKSLAPWGAAFRHLRWWRCWQASFTQVSMWQDCGKSSVMQTLR